MYLKINRFASTLFQFLKLLWETEKTS